MELLISKLRPMPGASEESIKQVQSLIRIELPKDYVQFIARSNGAKGFIGSSYIDLWPIESILPLSKSYHVDEHAPGIILFGTDGGGQAFGFDVRSDKISIVEIPFIPLRSDEAMICGETFTEFLKYVYGRLD